MFRIDLGCPVNTYFLTQRISSLWPMKRRVPFRILRTANTPTPGVGHLRWPKSCIDVSLRGRQRIHLPSGAYSSTQTVQVGEDRSLVDSACFKLSPDS